MTMVQFQTLTFSRMSVYALWEHRYGADKTNRYLALRELRRRGCWFGYRRAMQLKLVFYGGA